MAGIIIRSIKESDNLILAQIIREIFIEHNAPQEGTVYTDPTTDDLYTLFRKNNSILFVGEIDNKVVGCGGVYPTKGLPKGCAEFVKFYISPEARGFGLGIQIMKKSISWAKENSFDKLYIESLPHYAKAVSMYKKMGFAMLDKPIGQSGHPTCNIWMLKEL